MIHLNDVFFVRGKSLFGGLGTKSLMIDDPLNPEERVVSQKARRSPAAKEVVVSRNEGPACNTLGMPRSLWSCVLRLSCTLQAAMSP